MNTQEYLLDLIERMLDDTLEYVPEVDGSMYVNSNNAYKEASQLTDANYTEPLKQLVERYSSNKAKDKDVRRRVYHMLEKLAINTENNEIFEYFADRLAEESDKDILGDCLLLYLDRSTYIPSLYKILRLMEDNRWQVRDMVIKMLGNYPKQDVEDILMRKLSEAKDQYEISYLLSSLRKIHSTKVLEVIEKFLEHEKGNVRASAITTVNVLEGKQCLSTYMKALRDRSRDVKLNALSAILDHGDESVIGALIERLQTILKTKRKVEPGTISDSEVVKIVTFLLRYKDRKEVAALFDWIQQKKWDFLFEQEREWIQEHCF
jgi:HEAT repeat protein